jgi:hypothetical protein
MKEFFLLLVLAGAYPSAGAAPQATVAPVVVSQETMDKLLAVIASLDARIKELERKLENSSAPGVAAAVPVPATPVVVAVAAPPVPVQPQPPPQKAAASPDVPEDTSMGGHNMAIPNGPVLNIRGFFDFNFGVGSIANPLLYPIVSNGCGTCDNSPTPAHTAFQAGEFDLFMTSKLSDHLSFLAEVVLGPDDTNAFGLDIERYEFTYRANRYFSATAGRFHTSIGYYNTAYHHGNWFSTAEGRPIMYLFEDSGGILPVHMVGVTLKGEVPHTDSLGLHWVAEMGNGNSSNSALGPGGNAVQNFYSDRNYKATNLAAYIRPRILSGLQIGGSWYHDGINPSQAQVPLPLPEVRQNIESGYVVYFSTDWEFMTEGVMLSNHPTGTQAFRSPMAYTQIARRLGIYKPYFRYQYVRDNMNDPLNLLRGTYYGPSVGVRIDLAEYAAIKLQYNHLFQSGQLAGNGLNAQIAFTF